MADPDHMGPDGACHLSLDELLHSVYSSVVSGVRRNTEGAMAHLLANYFPLDPQTGQPAPRTLQLPVPGPNGTPIQRDLPLFTLAPPQDVAIEHLHLKMKLSLNARPGADGKPSLVVNFDAASGGEPAMAELDIHFRGAEAPEGLARINGAIVKHFGAE